MVPGVLDEDEAAAKAATPGPWRVVPPKDGSEWVIKPPLLPEFELLTVAGPGYEGGGVDDEADAVHIVRHDPRQVLARVKAERAVLGLWEDARLSPHGGAHGALTEAVRALVSGYRHRPGWGPAWACGGGVAS